MHHFGDLWKNRVSVQFCIIHTGGSLGKGTASVGLLRCVIASQCNKGLSVSTWRKRRGDFSPQQPCGAGKGGGVIIKFPVHPCIGFGANKGAGDPPKNWEMRLDGKSRGDRFAEGGCTFWHNDPCVFGLSLSRVFVGRWRVMGGKRAIQGGN